MDIITTHNLTRYFASLNAVKSLSLTIPEGELFGLVGSDGAGKTTILRMLAGILDPSGGEISVLGYTLPSDAEKIHDHIGYMSQRFSLYSDLTVAENIAFYADIFGVPKEECRVSTEKLLEFSGLAPFTGRLAGRLSGGMKQKLGLCCALIHKPRLLLLDEPTNGVDPVSRRDFWNILQELHSEGVTIIVASAYLDEAARCDRVGVIHEGSLIACGTVAELTGNGSTTLEELVIGAVSTNDRSLVQDKRYNPHDVRFEKENAPFAVSLNGITKRFGDFIAVDSVSLTVPKGEIFGFLGPNGAGKSTTIRMMCGILSPTSGNGTVAGFDIIRQAELIKENIGYMSQRFSLYEDLTVEENIAFYAGVYRLPVEKRMERIEWVISMAGVGDRRTSKAGELSGGWKQRLALGCAILHEPPVLFLDEPTSGVGPLSRRKFWELIRSMAAHGTTVFVTTHYMDEAEFCDRLAMIYQGAIVAVGSPLELKKQRAIDGVLPTLEELFIGLIEERNSES